VANLLRGCQYLARRNSGGRRSNSGLALGVLFLSVCHSLVIIFFSRWAGEGVGVLVSHQGSNASRLIIKMTPLQCLSLDSYSHQDHSTHRTIAYYYILGFLSLRHRKDVCLTFTCFSPLLLGALAALHRHTARENGGNFSKPNLFLHTFQSNHPIAIRSFQRCGNKLCLLDVPLPVGERAAFLQAAVIPIQCKRVLCGGCPCSRQLCILILFWPDTFPVEPMSDIDFITLL